MICYQLWIDDIRKPPAEGYTWIKDINEALRFIRWNKTNIYLIDIDHDAGEFAQYGGDYNKLLDWLEETGLNYPIRIHSMNPVGRENMRAIIQRNGWTEVM